MLFVVLSFVIAKLIFMAEEKLSILIFIFYRILSLAASFLAILSLILACSRINSSQGWLFGVITWVLTLVGGSLLIPSLLLL
jgi:hypothetical protein